MKPKYKIGDKVIHDSTVCFVVDRKYYESDQKYLYFITAIKGNHMNKVISEKYLKPYSESLEKEMEWNLPDGYQFVDENGNVINATKIVLEKKKKEYPKTFVEVLDYWYPDRELGDDYQSSYKKKLIEKFQDLLYARDAYWKIAGEEMELGKPWKPDWEDENQEKYIIGSWLGTIQGLEENFVSHPFAFPTSEMRDAFCENFKDLIKQCKELL